MPGPGCRLLLTASSVLVGLSACVPPLVEVYTPSGNWSSWPPHKHDTTHGDDAYYLNALAGDIRTMACSFDPALDHVRQGWSGLPADPRVPLVR